MQGPKVTRTAVFALLFSIAAACGGQLVDPIDDRVKASATDVADVDGSAPVPMRLPCPSGTHEGGSCAASGHRCTDDSTCSSPIYVCAGGTWRLESESSCAVEKKSACPDHPPSEQDWCPYPQATCRYADSCAQRPSNVAPMRTYECVGSRWTWVSARYDVTCPLEAPVEGSGCEPSCGREGACFYGGSCGSLSATCEPRSATWHLSGKRCADADAGASDAAATD